MPRPFPALALGLVALAAFGCARKSADAPAPTAAPRPTASAPQTPPAAPATASFKFATQTLTVPAGFTVELVAGPPLVNRPISIALDEQGRLYATDSSGLSDKAEKQVAEKPHRIVRLEDADGDGRFEKGTVFAEHMMFPEGALFYRGSLYVAAPPEIWKLTDADGDGVAERREVWYDGKTVTGCANDLHGPYLGPDGMIYWTKGAFAEQSHTLPNGKTMVSRAAHIFRARDDGSAMEPVLTGGMDNPVGLAFSATGERFLSGTFFQNPGGGKRDGLIHSVYGGVYGKENAAAAGHARTGDLMPIMTHMGAAAPCGETIYQSRAFGEAFAGNLFTCYFNLRKIVRHEIAADGATFTTRDSDFITSDSLDFHPTDVLEDADGSLLVADTGGWYKICCPTSVMTKPDVLGAVYRIRRNGAPRIDDPRGLKLPWATMPPDAVAQLLADPRPAVQQRALDTLGRQGAAAVPALGKLVASAPSAVTRRNALWALARIEGDAARAATRVGLGDKDSSVVHVAAQVASLWRDAAAGERLAALLAGDNPALARMAAEALGRIGDARAVAPLVAAVARLGETKITALGAPETAPARTLEHSLIYALIEIDRGEELLGQLAKAKDPRVIRAALVALDQMENGGLKAEHVARWLDSTVPMLKQTAAWIAGQHADWGGALADYYRGRLVALTHADAELQTQLSQLAKATAIQELLATTVSNASAALDARLLALRAMASTGLKDSPALWLSTLTTALGDPALTRQAVATARALPMPKTGTAELFAALARVGRDARTPDEVRVDALAIAPGAMGPVEPAMFDFLQAHLAPNQPTLVRGAAANALAKIPLAPAQQLALADALRSVGALELPKLLPAFERAANETLGLRLVAALKQSPGLPGVRANALKPLLSKYPKTVQAQGEELLAQLNADAARQSAHVEELLAGVKSGDERRGQVVFNSEKAACSLCHVIGYLGGKLGPDLTNIGRIRQPHDLLEAIVFPSATFVRGYEPFNVKTKSGELVSGLVRSENSDEVVLATGPESEQHIARAEIADIQPATVSPMPPGFEAMLTKQELADLLAFLVSRR